MRTGGRKGISNERIAAVLRETRGNRSATAQAVGTSVENIKQRIARSPDLQRVLHEAINDVSDVVARARVVVFKSVEDGDVGSAKWLLEKKGGYSTKTEVEARLPEDQLQALAQALASGNTEALRSLRSVLAGEAGAPGE